MTLISRHLLISGRVQGVCFRHYTRKTALANGVKGWARNLADGRVEALLEGEEKAVCATIEWCRQGPDLARVDNLEVDDQEVSREFEQFTIR